MSLFRAFLIITTRAFFAVNKNGFVQTAVKKKMFHLNAPFGEGLLLRALLGGVFGAFFLESRQAEDLFFFEPHLLFYSTALDTRLL